MDGSTRTASERDRAAWALGGAEARAFVGRPTSRLADLVASSLGPHGLETQIETADAQDEREVVRTADAGTMLDAIERGGGLSHPVAALFVDAVDAMERAHGDGTTRATLLTAALVERGLGLVERGLAPTTVARGYAFATSRIGETYDALAEPCDPDDDARLAAVARTAATRLDSLPDDDVSAVAGAVSRLAADDALDTEYATVIAARDAPAGIYRGVVARRFATGTQAAEHVPTEFDPRPGITDPIEDATVAIVDDELEFGESVAGGGDAVSVDGAAGARRYAEERAAARADFADRLFELGVDVLVSRPEVEADLAATLESRGVAVVDEVETPVEDVYRIARATGADVVSHPDDVTAGALGTAGSVVERRVGDECWAVFDDCDGPCVSLVATADTEAGCDRAEAALETAVEAAATAVRDDQVLPGAGAAEMAAAASLREYAPGIADREQLAVEAFADALERVPEQLVRNAGGDPNAVLPALRAAHDTGEPAAVGVAADGNGTRDAVAAGILDPRRVPSEAVETARSLATQLLTVDEVLHPGVDLAAVRPETES
ncbi:TCP-1/cpn60 chaperonin family protein [Halosimplex aquaticum]|uniref:TCP-1/cpn60 chaperonin family protein n=1 Tax=Halosimplex aquaticum TaxID=3026162 RepID=A0ABD5Y268_9EURY|nr:TCP-1/cpn60 chaperonin family protein [Halosimplex aquaticum]